MYANKNKRKATVEAKFLHAYCNYVVSQKTLWTFFDVTQKGVVGF